MAAPLSGQTLNDRILAARHSLAGQGLAKAVCKATTEEVIGPKKKHLDYLLHCTEEPNVSIPTLANLLIERAQSQNWVVVFKSLVTIHHLMCYGNEKFVQYLASSNTSFQLSNFLDKSGVQGYDMSPFIRRYATYLTEKSVSYRTVAFDFCKVKRGKDGGTLRQMSPEKLLKTLPVLQAQVDALLNFEVGTSDLTNGVINNSFMLLFRDLIRLFACYNDGIINLLEKYFDMNKKNARDALDTYKKFLIRMDRVAEFLKVAENVGVEKSDIPDLAKAPSSLLDALEAHLANLEGRKVGSPTSPSSSGAANVNPINDKVQQQLLAEEEQAMAKYKEQHKATNPFMAQAAALASATETDTCAATPNILDLFGMPDPSPQQQQQQQQLPPAHPDTKATSGSADLLQLSGNPFANIINQPDAFPAASTIDGGSAPGANFFGDILQPQGNTAGPPSGADLFGGQQPMMATNATTNGSNKNLVTGDLDSSIANLTSNLNLTGGPGKGSSLNPPRGPPMASTIHSTAFNASPFQPPFQKQPVSAFGMGNSVNKF